MNKILTLIFFISVLSFGGDAMANYSCVVKINGAIIYSNGRVTINQSARNQWTDICRLDGSMGGVDRATCALWAGLVTNAQKENDNVRLYYTGEGSCATLPAYAAAPVPYYVGLTN